jgi:hypothetical protein
VITIKDEEVTKDELEKRLRKAAWTGKRINGITMRDEEINFQTHPYICLFSLGEQNWKWSWRIRIYLINFLHSFRRLIKG